MSGFPQFRFDGAPQERGRAYGAQLRERIRATYSLYAETLFAGSPLSMAEIERRAEHVRALIADFSSDYVAELDAVAAGAEMPRWQIYALNARTEILNAPLAECTALYFQDTAILGQNWDWVSALEELAVLVTWGLPDGSTVLAFTEPGMLGKIGLNDRGIGVCLNFLVSAHELDGLPVHILTRALLDCGTLDEARAMLKRAGFGKSSHFLVADDGGNCCSVEFADGDRFEAAPQDGVLLHTNHCIAPAAVDKAALIPTTVERYDQGREWLGRTSKRDLETMKRILLDDSEGPTSINSSYHPEEVLNNQDVGTCATILMDLGARQMQIKKGPGRDGEFAGIAL
jgi:isopenicillin-N N-acyltransferase-like protein